MPIADQGPVSIAHRACPLPVGDVPERRHCVLTAFTTMRISVARGPLLPKPATDPHAVGPVRAATEAVSGWILDATSAGALLERSLTVTDRHTVSEGQRSAACQLTICTRTNNTCRSSRSARSNWVTSGTCRRPEVWSRASSRFVLEHLVVGTGASLFRTSRPGIRPVFHHSATTAPNLAPQRFATWRGSTAFVQNPAFSLCVVVANSLRLMAYSD